MSKRMRTDQERIEILEQIKKDRAEGMTVAKSCKKHGIVFSQYHAWKKKFGGENQVVFHSGQTIKTKKSPQEKADKLVALVGKPSAVLGALRELGL